MRNILCISCSWTVRNEYVKGKCCAILNVMCILLNIENTDRIYRLYVGRYLREVIDGQRGSTFHCFIFKFYLFVFFLFCTSLSLWSVFLGLFSDFLYHYTYYIFIPITYLFSEMTWNGVWCSRKTRAHSIVTAMKNITDIQPLE